MVEFSGGLVHAFNYSKVQVCTHLTETFLKSRNKNIYKFRRDEMYVMKIYQQSTAVYLEKREKSGFVLFLGIWYIAGVVYFFYFFAAYGVNGLSRYTGIMQPRTSSLLTKVNNNVELMLQKYQDMISLSLVLDKSQETLAIETLQIESNSTTIIRLAEELLTMTRALKESWILGQVPLVDSLNFEEKEVVESADGEKSVKITDKSKEVYEMINALLENVTSLNHNE